MLKRLMTLIKKMPDMPPHSFGWRFISTESNGFEIRRKYPIRYFSGRTWPIRWGLIFLLYFYWPLHLLFLCRRFIQKFGQQAEKIAGVPKAIQWKELIYLTAFCSVSPREYYFFELFRNENRSKKHQYFYLSDMTRWQAIFPQKQTREFQIVNDKKGFEAFCQQHNFPCAKSFHYFRKGKTENLKKVISSLNEKPFVLKPCIGCRGEGVFIFKPNKDGYLINNQLTSFETSILKISDLLKNGDYLIQETLNNHPDLEKLSNGALINLRIITLMDENGETEYLAAVVQLPFGNQPTSNQGMIAVIDKKNGQLGNGRKLGAISPELVKHPTTEHSIAGRELPWWQEIKQLVLEAHRKVGKYTSLGWDVAITKNGPVLLETNSGWDMGMIQRAVQVPLGETRLAELILNYSKTES